MKRGPQNGSAAHHRHQYVGSDSTRLLVWPPAKVDPLHTLARHSALPEHACGRSELAHRQRTRHLPPASPAHRINSAANSSRVLRRARPQPEAARWATSSPTRVVGSPAPLPAARRRFHRDEPGPAKRVTWHALRRAGAGRAEWCRTAAVEFHPPTPPDGHGTLAPGWAGLQPGIGGVDI